jgi:hypothetical protein
LTQTGRGAKKHDAVQQGSRNERYVERIALTAP